MYRTPRLFLMLLVLSLLPPIGPVHAADGVMDGVPPSRESQVTFRNYRDYPMSTWAFRNMGAPANVVMVPRQGEILDLGSPLKPEIGAMKFTDLAGETMTLEELFGRNYANGLVVIRGGRLLYEHYFNGLTEHKQHIWFSMSKSLVSTAFGLLVEAGKVDLKASPVKYIPELKGSGFERVTIQNLLDHDTAIDFKENYTDFESDFFRYYAPAANLAWLPGARDAQPDSTEIYGLHDFLGKFVKADPALKPGDAFDYNSSNTDVVGWLVARISGLPLADFLQQNIWAKLGAEHDAYFAVDRAYQAVATGGMNSTLRDAGRFGMMIRDEGKLRGEQIVPADWVNATLRVSDRVVNNMRKNPKYSADPWQAYHNMWWLLDADAGEYAAVGIHGQVIYINRSVGTVMAWFSSQPTASAASNPVFHSKLKAARELAQKLD